MRKKYSSQGLVIIMVSVDAAKERKDVVGFLEKQKLSFPQVLLDEKTKFWQEKLRFEARPCYYLFDRKGKWTQFKGENGTLDYGIMENTIKESLQER